MPWAWIIAALLAGIAGIAFAARRAGAATDDAAPPGALDRVLEATYTAENFIKDTMGTRRSMSIAGLDQLKNEESPRGRFNRMPYQDAAGFWTIGYGHKLKGGEWYDTIDEAQATSLLAGDVRDAEDAVNSLVSVDLNQSEFDALVSFTFNVGAGALRRSTLLAKLNADDAAGAAAEFARWNRAGGRVNVVLAERREREAELFTTGNYA
ncbi:MAG TPA: lysozyme [Burkholderiales bacterium]|nr:lysozyme [Burkholderiales bacterium]